MSGPRMRGEGDGSHRREDSSGRYGVPGPKRWGMALVRGRSMRPTLHEGDRLLVRHGAAPRVGDLVVVRLPRRVGGGTVVAVKRATRQEPGAWWVECDNSREGVDSWSVGVIADRDVIAIVRCRIWPLRRVAH